jgi:undecaprenyl-diphosphatase
VLASLLLAVLLVELVGVLVDSPLVALDEAVYRWAPEQHWPQLSGFLRWWVVAGQRAVCLALAALWLGWRAWRTRDRHPLVVLLVATLLTNVTVGGMKTLVGRLGPLQLGMEAVLPGAGSVFVLGGTIFPSGHTANAVVTWGVLALLARSHRRLGVLLAGIVAVSVGLTTVYLGTHWLSDVIAGWCAGGLVLLVLPVAVPWAEQMTGVLLRSGSRLLGRAAADVDGGSSVSPNGGLRVAAGPVFPRRLAAVQVGAGTSAHREVRSIYPGAAGRQPARHGRSSSQRRNFPPGEDSIPTDEREPRRAAPGTGRGGAGRPGTARGAHRGGADRPQGTARLGGVLHHLDP